MTPLSKALFAAIVSMALCGSAVAQDASPSPPPPLPPGPLIRKRAADMAAWSVISKNAPKEGANANAATDSSDTQEKAHGAVGKVTVVKTGDIRVVQRVDEDGQAWNVWCVGTLQVMAWSDGKSCAVLTPPPNKDTSNPFYTDFRSSDFQGFEWLSLDNYTAIESFQGRQCIVFKRILEIPFETSELPPTRIPVVAYVDLDSRLPIYMQQGEKSFTYDWKAPPKNKLTPPPNVQALLDQRQRAIDQFSRKAVKPF